MNDLLSKIQDLGILVDHLNFDGMIYRHGTRAKPHSKNGWVKSFPDQRGAVVGDHAGGWQQYVGTNGDQGPLSPELIRKIDEARAEAQAKREADYEAAALEAKRIYESAAPCTGHPYLEKKQVAPEDGLRVVRNGNLIVPVFGPDDLLQSLQYINAAGDKWSLNDGRMRGGKFYIDGPDKSAFIIGEGLATVLSAAHATGHPAFVAFNTGGLLPVAKLVREHDPHKKIIFAADNDTETPGNPGLQYATEAAKAVGGVVALPDMPGDWNDVQVAKGIQAVKEGILGAKEQEQFQNKFQKKIIHAADLHAAFLKTLGQGWTIKGILPEAAMLNVIYGPPGTFKSFIELDMALCISTGIKWHGREVKKRPVCYIAAEGQTGMLKRIEAWKKYHGVDDIGEFYLLPMPALLDDEDEKNELIHAVKSLPTVPGYVVFDTLARSMQGDENKTPDMNKVVRCCGEIIDATGAQIKIVHHTGKDVGRGTRGSIALPGATETVYCTKHEDEENMQVAFICERQKDEEKGKPIVFNMAVVDTGFVNVDHDTVTSLVPVYDLDATANYSETSKRKKEDSMKGSTRAVWDAFLEAWEKYAEQPEQEVKNAMGTDIIAMGMAKVVHEDKWRERAYQHPDLTTSEEYPARKMAFNRGKKSLLGMQKISGCQNYFWKK